MTPKSKISIYVNSVSRESCPVDTSTGVRMPPSTARNAIDTASCITASAMPATVTAIKIASPNPIRHWPKMRHFLPL